MTVYADEVFFLNALLDFLLLQTANLLSDSPKKLYRSLLSAAFGGVYAAFAAAVPFLGGLLPQLIAFACMCVLAYGIGMAVLRRAALLLLVCCGFGGLALLAAVLLHCPLRILYGVPCFAISKRLLILLAGGLYAAVWLTVRRLCRHMGGTVRVMLTFSGRHAEVTALCDTGNTLKDPVTAEPVIIADLKTAQKLLPQIMLTENDLKNPAALIQSLRRAYPASKPRLLPFRTVGQSGMLAAIRCDAVFVNGKLTGQHLAAFSAEAFTGEETYQAITGGIYELEQMHIRAPSFGALAQRNGAIHRRQRHSAAASERRRGAGTFAESGTGR